MLLTVHDPSGRHRQAVRSEGIPLGGKAREIRIDTVRCKGCGICVEFCPTKVLILAEGAAAVADLDRCTACNLCDLRCPDFAITVVPSASEKTAA